MSFGAKLMTMFVSSVPGSDVTIELYSDGTLVTRDKSETNYSKVNCHSTF